MKLFFADETLSLAIHIVLLESGLDFEIEESIRKWNLDPNYISTSRIIHGVRVSEESLHCYAPFLKCDNGELLEDVLTSLQYIADQVPHLGLAGRNEIERQMLESWLTFISHDMYSNLIRVIDMDGDDDVLYASMEVIKQSLETLNTTLKGDEFLLGERFTIADAYILACLFLHPMRYFDLGNLKNFSKYYDFLLTRPSVKRALKDEGFA